MQQISNDSSVSVTTSPTLVLPRRASRVSYVITNLDPSNAVTLSKGEKSATYGQGVILYPLMSMNESDDPVFRCWRDAIIGIASAGTVTLSINEVMVI